MSVIFDQVVGTLQAQPEGNREGNGGTAEPEDPYRERREFETTREWARRRRERLEAY